MLTLCKQRKESFIICPKKKNAVVAFLRLRERFLSSIPLSPTSSPQKNPIWIYVRFFCLLLPTFALLLRICHGSKVLRPMLYLLIQPLVFMVCCFLGIGKHYCELIFVWLFISLHLHFFDHYCADSCLIFMLSHSMFVELIKNSKSISVVLHFIR